MVMAAAHKVIVKWVIIGKGLNMAPSASEERDEDNLVAVLITVAPIQACSCLLFLRTNN